MIKVSIAALLICVFAMMMSTIRTEYSFFVLLLGGVLLSIVLLGKMKVIIQILASIQSKSGISGTYLKILFKLIGISFIGDFVSNICKDAKEETIAKQVEMISKLSILIVSLPVLQSLIKIIETLLE